MYPSQQSRTYSILTMAESEKSEKIHLVKGYLFPPFLTEEWLETVSSVFKPKDTDIFVASNPKSGTHWLSYIVYMIKKKEKLTDAFFGRVAFCLEIPQVDQLEPGANPGPLKIEEAAKWIVTKERVAALPDPRFIFTHCPFEYLPINPATKYIYIYRNPKDIVVSLYHHYTVDKFDTFIGTFDEFFQLYMDKNCFNYCEQLKEYINHKDDPNLFILTFEELRSQFKLKVNEIANFLDVDLTEEHSELIMKETSFEIMRENPFINGNHAVKEGAYFFPKGQVGTWKAKLSEEQSKKMDEFLLAKLGEDFIKKYVTFS